MRGTTGTTFSKASFYNLLFPAAVIADKMFDLTLSLALFSCIVPLRRRRTTNRIQDLMRSAVLHRPMSRAKTLTKSSAQCFIGHKLGGTHKPDSSARPQFLLVTWVKSSIFVDSVRRIR